MFDESNIPPVPRTSIPRDLDRTQTAVLNRLLYPDYDYTNKAGVKLVQTKRLEFPKITDETQLMLSTKNLTLCKNIDNYLEDFLKVKIELIRSITDQDVDGLTRAINSILTDNSCLWNMGKYAERHHREFDMACEGCKLLRRFIKEREQKNVTVQCGKLAIHGPFDLKLEETFNYNLLSHLEEKPFKGYRELLSVEGVDFLDQENSAKSLTSNAYLNNIIISSIVESKMTRMNMPHSRIIYFGFICRNNGYTLIENNKIMKLEDLNRIIESGHNDPRASAMDAHNFFSMPIIRTIINQLLASLHLLSYYSFTFGKYGLNNIGFERKRVEYTYDGVSITGEYALKYMDFTNSSMTVRSVDRAKVTRVSDTDTLQSGYHMDELDLLNLEEINLSDGKWIKLSDTRSMILYEKYRHFGFILKASVLDFYAYFIAIMSYNKFFDSFINDSNYNWIWYDMWRPEEYEMIKYKLRSPLLSKTDVLAALTNIYMRADITDRIWRMYKQRMQMTINSYNMASPTQSSS